MQQPSVTPVSRTPRRSQEEDRAWAYLYRDADDATVAAEVVKHLDSDTEIRRTHTALYLRCKQAVRREKLRQERNQRIAGGIKLAIATIVIRPLRALRSMLFGGGAIALEMLPHGRKEPAVPRLQELRGTPEFAQAIATVPATPAAVPASRAGKSRRAQAA